MQLEAISGAATIAVASTIIYLLIAKTWNAANRAITATPSFSDRILRESAQRFRDELDRLTTSQSAYLGAGLVFIMLFMAAWFLNAGVLFEGYPRWQLYLLLVVLCGAALFAGYRLTRTVLRRRQVKFMRDATIAMSHQLQQLPAGFARVYHDVPTTAGIIDHVLVGLNGIYAVNVVAVRAAKRGDARLVENTIEFSTGKPAVPIITIAARANRLQKEFGEVLGHTVKVRSVVALPGWNIGDQVSREHLLVNERTIPMLTGWKDNSDFLMDDDVDALYRDLGERCMAT